MQKFKKINPSALRAYDIRGGIGEMLFEEDAYYIGKAYATKIIRKKGIKNPLLALGYDGRLTTPNMQKLACQGMVEAGAKVVNVGLGPSPMLYFSVRSDIIRQGGLDGGMMVTASHNPSHHNGFKMMYSKSPLFGEDIQELGRICESGDFEDNEGGSLTFKDISEEYIARILEAFDGGQVSGGRFQVAEGSMTHAVIPAKAGILNNSESKISDISHSLNTGMTFGKNSGVLEFLNNLKIAWDPGNGAAGEITSRLTKKLPGKHFMINEKIDGNFPAHHPDPTVAENLEQLIDCVKKNNCDLGIAFDGDGDRIGAVDGKGRIIWGDQLMTIYADDVLSVKKGETIIADVKASQSFFDKVAELGGIPVMWKTGHSYIKNKLAETGAALAGEMSGHIFFNDRYYGYDDAVYSGLRLINYFANRQMKPSEVVDKLPITYASKEYRVRVPEKDKLRIVEEITAKILKTYPSENINQIDGIRIKESKVDNGSGWWLLRSSNTQSVLTIRAEALTVKGLNELLNILQELLKPYGVDNEIK